MLNAGVSLISLASASVWASLTEWLRLLPTLTATSAFAAVFQELELGLRSIAVPLYDASGQAIAALNIGAHASRTDADAICERFLPPLQQAAQQVSAALTASQSFAS